MNKRIAIAMLASLALFGAASARAGIIAEETWDTPGNADGWSITPESGSAGSGSVPLAFGNPISAFQIDNNTAGAPPGPDVALLTTTTGPLLGDYSAAGNPVSPGKDQRLSFDFYLDSTLQAGGFNSLQVYFSPGGGVTWYYAIDVSAQGADTWANYAVNFADDTGWTDVGSSINGFDIDKTTVTEIGFRITYLDDTAGQMMAFDNIRREFVVPEPETYAAIGFGLLAMVIAFRKRLTEMLAMVRLPGAL